MLAIGAEPAGDDAVGAGPGAPLGAPFGAAFDGEADGEEEEEGDEEGDGEGADEASPERATKRMVAKETIIGGDILLDQVDLQNKLNYCLFNILFRIIAVCSSLEKHYKSREVPLTGWYEFVGQPSFFMRSSRVLIHGLPTQMRYHYIACRDQGCPSLSKFLIL